MNPSASDTPAVPQSPVFGQNPVVHAESIVKRYDGFTAVDGVSFSVRPGEIYGFLGPNGAGKTTTIGMLRCLFPPTGGKLEIFGLDPSMREREIKRIIGVVPQENLLDSELTVLQNMRLYAGYFFLDRATAADRIERLLDFLALDSVRDRKVRRLSGGMQRRLTLARALINTPKLLILDEPTTGLDPQARHMIWQRLRELNESGLTIFLTTHYMEEAARLCNRVSVIDNGKILLEGKPAELVADKIGAEVIELRTTPQEMRRVTDSAASAGFNTEQAGDTLFIFLRAGAGHELLKSLAQGDHDFFHHRKASLEDLFLKLTGRALRD